MFLDFRFSNFCAHLQSFHSSLYVFLDALASHVFKLSVTHSLTDTFFRSSINPINTVNTFNTVNTVNEVNAVNTVNAVNIVNTVNTVKQPLHIEHLLLSS